MKRKKKAGPNYNRYGWAFIAAAFLLYLIFTIYPAVESLALAFQSLEGGKYIFVGLKNFVEFLGGRDFIRVFKNTLMISLWQILICFPVFRSENTTHSSVGASVSLGVNQSAIA